MSEDSLQSPIMVGTSINSHKNTFNIFYNLSTEKVFAGQELMGKYHRWNEVLSSAISMLQALRHNKRLLHISDSEGIWWFVQ
jgi:hypothetical protein